MTELNIEEIDTLINADCATASKHIYSGLKCFAKIVSFVDGDTIKVVFHFHGLLVENKIRLLGINAPESRTLDLKEKAKGIAAKKYFETICKTNIHNIVYIECDKFDDFGRVLGHVYQIYFGETCPNTDAEPFGDSNFIFKNKKSLNTLMVETGHARPFMV